VTRVAKKNFYKSLLVFDKLSLRFGNSGVYKGLCKDNLSLQVYGLRKLLNRWRSLYCDYHFYLTQKVPSKSIKFLSDPLEKIYETLTTQRRILSVGRKDQLF